MPRKNNNKSNNRPLQQKVLVICAETEKSYLQVLICEYKIKNVDFFKKPLGRKNKNTIPNKKTFEYLKKKELEKSHKAYKAVYHIFDVEDIKKTQQLNGIGAYINDCKNSSIRIYDTDITITPLPQLPSIEAWFLLHFDILVAPTDLASDCEKKLKQKMMGYNKNNTRDWTDIVDKTQDAIDMYDNTEKRRQTDYSTLNALGITHPDMNIVQLIKKIVNGTL